MTFHSDVPADEVRTHFLDRLCEASPGLRELLASREYQEWMRAKAEAEARREAYVEWVLETADGILPIVALKISDEHGERVEVVFDTSPVTALEPEAQGPTES